MSSASPQAAKRQTDREQAKAKKQKKILAVLSVFLLAIAGYQLPKFMGGSNTTAAEGGTPATAPIDPLTPLTPAPTPLATELPDTDRVVVQPQSGQLLSFGLFKSKDPFVQQLGAVDTTAAPTSEAPTPIPAPTIPDPAQPHTPPAPPSTDPVVPSSAPRPVTFPTTTTPTPAPTPAPTSTQPVVPTPTTPTSTTPTTPATAPGTVAISTNGVCELVALKATFPKSGNLFRVTSIGKDGKSAKIAIVGGAYDSGAGAATIKRGEDLTLVNTADGTRYVMKLLASCDVETSPAPRAETQPTTTTSSTPTTTTTSTTPAAPTSTEPIVEDELDNGEAEEQASQ